MGLIIVLIMGSKTSIMGFGFVIMGSLLTIMGLVLTETEVIFDEEIEAERLEPCVGEAILELDTVPHDKKSIILRLKLHCFAFEQTISPLISL